MRPTKQLSWDPKKRRGGVYCSDACGADCTMEEYKRAVKSSKDLVKELGPGWVARVWENIGWHHEAIRGDIHVMPSSRGSGKWFTAYFNAATQTIGEGFTPQEAVRLAISEMRDYVAVLNKAIKRATTKEG